MSIVNHSLLSGHKGAVTSLAGTSFNILASGSEDKTVRLWDLKTNKVTKCYRNIFSDEIDSIRFDLIDEYLLFVASSNNIFTFDIRTGGIIDSNFISSISENIEGEINSFDIDSEAKRFIYSDDSERIFTGSYTTDGHIILGEEETKTQFPKVHENMIGSLKIFGKSPEKKVVSGGFDYKIVTWDLNTGLDINSTLVTNPATLESSKQIFNPPFVQNLEVILEGRYILSCLGDGSIKIHNSSELNEIKSFEAHAGPITSLYINKNEMITGAIDKSIISWKIQSEKSKSKRGGKPIFKHLERLFTLSHSDKINALYSMQIDSQKNIYVADTSNDISIYHIA